MASVSFRVNQLSVVTSPATKVFVNSFLRLATKEASKLCITGPFVREKTSATGGLTSQRVSNAESVFICHVSLIKIALWKPYYGSGACHSGDSLWTWINIIPARINNYIYYNVWGEITFPFPNFNGATVEVWEWISNFILHFIMDLVIHPFRIKVKRGTWWLLSWWSAFIKIQSV